MRSVKKLLIFLLCLLLGMGKFLRIWLRRGKVKTMKSFFFFSAVEIWDIINGVWLW